MLGTFCTNQRLDAYHSSVTDSQALNISEFYLFPYSRLELHLGLMILYQFFCLLLHCFLTCIFILFRYMRRKSIIKTNKKISKNRKLRNQNIWNDFYLPVPVEQSYPIFINQTQHNLLFEQIMLFVVKDSLKSNSNCFNNNLLIMILIYYCHLIFKYFMRSQSNFFKPFAIPTQINNIGVLILAYVVYSVNLQTKCGDESHKQFLNFILYGSLIVYGFTFILTILYMCGIIDNCLNRLTLCGQVCLTINALGIFIFGFIYHFIATLYGVYELFFETKSTCIELQIFRKVNGLIYTIWMVAGIFYLLLLCKGKQINTPVIPI